MTYRAADPPFRIRNLDHKTELERIRRSLTDWRTFRQDKATATPEDVNALITRLISLVDALIDKEAYEEFKESRS